MSLGYSLHLSFSFLFIIKRVSSTSKFFVFRITLMLIFNIELIDQLKLFFNDKSLDTQQQTIDIQQQIAFINFISIDINDNNY